MIERGLYYATSDFTELIKSVGGEWNDPKHRPIVCLVKSTENADLYWAIPMGNWNHRSPQQQARLQQYLDLKSDISLQKKVIKELKYDLLTALIVKYNKFNEENAII